MLQIKNISKTYKTGNLVQRALDDVSLNLRDNEFVAILGPSGSGKTTLLNIIGGLDRYDSGDLIINGISTKKYKDRDWDSYRNHTVGFVFQSYNLIPHQTVLANVELALTISGISGKERQERAIKALEEVGLGDQIHKKPNQMSGGQMQRVSLARALVNNPDILLADEPTGALDSETSIQVMDLLKEVAKDRLVVMVTHNPELAYQYATRIVKVKDGKLDSIQETLKIQLYPDGHLTDLDTNTDLDPETVVSMNFWGFMPSIFPALRAYFEAFLRGLPDGAVKAECLLPVMVGEELKAGRMTVSVLNSKDKWFGMTYHEDRALVAEDLQKLHEAGVYPPSLRN